MGGRSPQLKIGASRTSSTKNREFRSWETKSSNSPTPSVLKRSKSRVEALGQARPPSAPFAASPCRTCRDADPQATHLVLPPRAEGCRLAEKGDWLVTKPLNRHTTLLMAVDEIAAAHYFYFIYSTPCHFPHPNFIPAFTTHAIIPPFPPRSVSRDVRYGWERAPLSGP